MPSTPATRDLLLIGGGHAHAIVLRRFAMRPLPGARLTLIEPGPVAYYSGMLPGFVSGAYTLDEISIDLPKLARWAGARLVLDAATAIDPIAREVRLQSGRSVGYDVLSLNAGSTSEAPAIDDPDAVLCAVKPLANFISTLECFIEDVRAGRRAPSVRVIGAGVGGAELAMALRSRLAALGAQAIDITMIERGDSALASMAPAPRRSVLNALKERGISVRTGVIIASARQSASGVTLVSTTGEEEETAVAFVAAGARAPAFIASSGLETDASGFVAVDRRLQSRSHPGTFAAGDTAAMIETPRAKAGVFAVRQGPVLAHNLEAALRGSPKRSYHAQQTWLKLLALGDGRAIGEKGSLALDGPPVVQRILWKAKNWIDRGFMRKFEPPVMAPPDPPSRAAAGVAEAALTGMLCGGCGSKVGDGALRAALGGLPDNPVAPEGIEILRGVGDDAAVLRPQGSAPLVWTTDHFRAFLGDPWLLARIAAIHALGDVRAMGATASAALLSLTLEEAAPPLQGRDLAAALDGARSVFDAAGVALVGGHSALGAELAIGVSLLGRAASGRWIGLEGAQPGDALVLTRPIGLGVVLAGEMAMQAKARDVAAAWTMMAEDKAIDAAMLAPQAHAMTDVTGFGLGGHLLSMLEASRVDAALDLALVSLVPGAAALSAAGVESSVAPSNRQRLEPFLEGEASARAHPAVALLFDPQTSGGFLAAMPEYAAVQAVEQLQGQGVPAAIVGHISPRKGAAATLTLTA